MKRTRSTYLALTAILLTPIAANADPISIDFDVLSDEGSVTGIFTGDDTNSDGSLTAGEISYFTATATGTAFTGGPFTIDPIEAVIDLLTFNISTFSLIGLEVNNGWTDVDDREAIRISGSSLDVWLGRKGSGRPITSVTARPTTVPEPGTLALLGIGLAGMGLASRRRKA